MDDYLAATGTWPGGRRINLRIVEDIKVREWTLAQKVNAYHAGYRLPVIWRFRLEKWEGADGKLYGRWDWIEPLA